MSKWLKFNKFEMSIKDALIKLNDLVDESDPDTSLPNIVHAFQTAESIRENHPELDWFHLTGLIHDLGKVNIFIFFGILECIIEVYCWSIILDATNFLFRKYKLWVWFKCICYLYFELKFRKSNYEIFAILKIPNIHDSRFGDLKFWSLPSNSFHLKIKFNLSTLFARLSQNLSLNIFLHIPYIFMSKIFDSKPRTFQELSRLWT